MNNIKQIEMGLFIASATIITGICIASYIVMRIYG